MGKLWSLFTPPPPPTRDQEGGERCHPQGPASSEVTRAQQAHWELRSLECSWGREGREENCFAGGGWHGSPFAQPPPPLPWSPCREGGLGWGCPTCRAGGGGGRGGGSDPNIPWLKNDPHIALIIYFDYTYVGENVFVKKFSGPKFVFRRLWWHIRPYTKQKARHGSPFLEPPPPPPSPGAHAIPPPQSNFRAAKCSARPRTFLLLGRSQPVWHSVQRYL